MKLYYAIIFAFSVLLTGIYAIIWRKRFSVFLTLNFAFIPIVNLGYYIIILSTTVPEAIIGIKISYLGIFLHIFIMYTIFNLCNLNIKKSIRLILFGISTFFFISSLTIGSSSFFYKEISGEIIDNQLVLYKKYGLVHTLYYIQIFIYMIITISATLYAFCKKNDVSRHNLRYMVACESISVLSFFAGKLLKVDVDLIPLSYVLGQVVMLMISRRIILYDVTETAIETISANGKTGFASFDEKFRYLGSNQIAKEIYPELGKLKVDNYVPQNSELNNEIIEKIRTYVVDSKKNTFIKKFGKQIYQIDISRLFDGRNNLGYILYMQDDTKNRKYISLLNKFNDKLKTEVSEKTRHIIEMHDNLIIGMATMVESRDNSTGGHIKRTSKIVQFLIDEIQNDSGDNSLKLTEKFGNNLIKAAPMHDLGKIAVDDAVLRKPGRFTAEEFEKMKIHAAEGARIVHEILKDTDQAFGILAENVAHYHHERWDGSGYPEGLKGEEIPLEARIMAIADVYDALVSKRVYKESMSFEKANNIMMESFGKHFDNKLKKYYIAARPKLEEYYSKL
ncbi:MAG: HD domain-containing protein [Spirochaetales bacterium]|nr:HD domain-containing protein [Spirochaetales bacterium]